MKTAANLNIVWTLPFPQEWAAFLLVLAIAEVSGTDLQSDAAGSGVGIPITGFRFVFFLSLKKILVVEKRGARGGGGVDWGAVVG